MTASKDMQKTMTCQKRQADGKALFLACFSVFVMQVLSNLSESHFCIFSTSIVSVFLLFLENHFYVCNPWVFWLP